MKYYTSVYILLCIKEMFQITNFSRKKSKVTATNNINKKTITTHSATSVFIVLLLSSSQAKIIMKFFIFTALHVMQTRYSEENSVCLSVRHTRGL